MRFFDAHAHLTAVPAFAGAWVIPGVDATTDAAAPTGPGVLRAVGLHPWYLDDLEPQLASLRERVADDVVAIGETGLDAMDRAGPRDRQERAFRAQIRLAAEHDLPLILHVVRRHGACLQLLEHEGWSGAGMVHDFMGPVEMIQPWVRAGFLLSVSPRAVRRGRAAVAAAIPDEALLIETDDEGAEQIGPVARWVAEARGMSVEEIAALTEANARRLFGLSERAFP